MLIDQGAADLGILNGQGSKAKAERARLKEMLDDMSEQAAYIGMAWGLMLTFYPQSGVNSQVLAPIMAVLLIIVTKNLFVRYV